MSATADENLPTEPDTLPAPPTLLARELLPDDAPAAQPVSPPLRPTPRAPWWQRLHNRLRSALQRWLGIPAMEMRFAREIQAVDSNQRINVQAAHARISGERRELTVHFTLMREEMEAWVLQRHETLAGNVGLTQSTLHETLELLNRTVAQLNRVTQATMDLQRRLQLYETSVPQLVRLRKAMLEADKRRRAKATAEAEVPANAAVVQAVGAAIEAATVPPSTDDVLDALDRDLPDDECAYGEDDDDGN